MLRFGSYWSCVGVRRSGNEVERARATFVSLGNESRREEMLSTLEWAQQNFCDCELGDKRRVKRLINVAEQVVTNPSGSLPEQFPEWSELSAAYRLFAADEVTFESIATPHWQRTRNCGPGVFLILNDTTEFDFGNHRGVANLGPTGNGGGYGFLQHNALMVKADRSSIVGLAAQKIHYRKPAPKKENNVQKLSRKRESQIWGEVVNAAGQPPEGAQWIHVCDRGGDNFELFCHFVEQRVDWVVRCSHLNRKIEANGDKIAIRDFIEDLEELGSYEMDLRSRPGVKARTATLTIQAGSLVMPLPRHRSAYVKDQGAAPIPMQIVVAEEPNPPKGTKPLRWVLLTSLPVKTFDDAWTIIEHHEARWLIEEYHKAEKTGCKITSRQLGTKDRLEAMVGLMSVVAVRLLQLKFVASREPDRPAKSVVPSLWLKMLKAARRKLNRIHDLTVGQFYREVAKLGGFLGRKCDGNPGWITVWRGWEKLNNMVYAVELATKNKITA